jgi:hypothetical protein
MSVSHAVSSGMGCGGAERVAPALPLERGEACLCMSAHLPFGDVHVGIRSVYQVVVHRAKRYLMPHLTYICATLMVGITRTFLQYSQINEDKIY